MPRLVRRQPLSERIRAYLNPVDLAFWILEELESNDWDEWEKAWAWPIGFGLNLIFLIARANVGIGRRRPVDDVFGDEDTGSGLLGWLVS